ncbi:hypothetical protein MN608_02767 [Microdochium nivale]|nr:hypothetical protein MN608_02767 [Microdochium nivale]
MFGPRVLFPPSPSPSFPRLFDLGLMLKLAEKPRAAKSSHCCCSETSQSYQICPRTCEVGFANGRADLAAWTSTVLSTPSGGWRTLLHHHGRGQVMQIPRGTPKSDLLV